MEKEKEKEQVERFLGRHMLKSHPPEYAYQCCAWLYYAYLAEGLQEAQKIEDGEVFDEFRNVALVNELKEAHESLRAVKRLLKHKTDLYDISEQLTFPGGRVKAGVFTGDSTAAVAAARQWVSSYQNRPNKPFLFEVGIYILMLMGEDGPV